MLANKLWRLFMFLGSAGVFWVEFEALSTKLQLQFKDARLKRWYEMPTPTTECALGQWNSWSQFAFAEAVDARSPPVLVLELWLQSKFNQGTVQTPAAPLAAFSL